MITLAAVGDILLTELIESSCTLASRDELFHEIRPILVEADIAFGNLECALSAGGSPDYSKEFLLRASPGWAAVLKRAGFDVLCLANNHIMDYGQVGMYDTLRSLREQEIAYVGVGGNLGEACEPVIRDVRGTKIGLIAFTYSHPATRTRPGCCPRDLARARDLIAGVRARADIVVVSLHDGLEYVDYPSRELMVWFRSAIDAGATVVLGHHPHVVQGIEHYNGGLICYSLGNFLSDYSSAAVRREAYAKTALTYFSPTPLEIADLRTTESFILRCTLAPGRVLDYSLVPIRTTASFSVARAAGPDADVFLTRMQCLSEGIASPDPRVLDEIDSLLRKSAALNLKRLPVKAVLAAAMRLRPRHLKLLIPFVKAKLASESEPPRW